MDCKNYIKESCISELFLPESLETGYCRICRGKGKDKPAESWKTLRKVAEEVAALKGCSVEDCFPFEIESKSYPGQSGTEFLIVNGGSRWENADGSNAYFDPPQCKGHYKLSDPCMWSLSNLRSTSPTSTKLCICPRDEVPRFRGCTCGGN